jgi:cytochrome c6
MVFLSFNTPAWAGDAAAGKAIFSAKCAQCHLGGKNILNPTKTLSMADLKTNKKDSLEAIIEQVTKGKAQMPKFLGQLTEDQIKEVATYVLAQAEANWPK